jgi:hypothetical protein
VSAIGAAAVFAASVFVLVAAAYLIRVALILRHVVRRLNTVLGAVAAVGDEAEPIGEVAGAINAELSAALDVLQDAADQLARPSEPAAASQRSHR